MLAWRFKLSLLMLEFKNKTQTSYQFFCLGGGSKAMNDVKSFVQISFLAMEFCSIWAQQHTMWKLGTNNALETRHPIPIKCFSHASSLSLFPFFSLTNICQQQKRLPPKKGSPVSADFMLLQPPMKAKRQSSMNNSFSPWKIINEVEQVFYLS